MKLGCQRPNNRWSIGGKARDSMEGHDDGEGGCNLEHFICYDANRADRMVISYGEQV